MVHSAANKKHRTLFLSMLIILSIVIMIPTAYVRAAESKVMVTDYEVSGDTVVSGKKFNLTLTIKNTASRNVKNMKLSVQSEEGTLLPVKGAGTEYISELPAGESRQISFDMQASKGLSERSYKVTVKMEYEDTAGYSYTVEDVIYIPVTQEYRISVTDIVTDSEVKVGSDTEIMAMVNNLGEGKIYNVSARVEGEHIDKQTSYIGNIDSGLSKAVDIIVKTNKITEFGDSAKDYLYVTYEDASGASHEEKVELGIMIMTSNYNDLTVLKTEENEDKSAKWIIPAVAFACLAVVIVIYIIIRIRKKKRINEEF